MKCQFCNQELPDGAKFCSACNKQIVCKECGAALPADSTICVFCGVDITPRSQTGTMNHIEYAESVNSKSFKADFSDSMAANVVSTYASHFLPQNNFALPRPNASLVAPVAEDVEAEEVSAMQNEDPIPKQKNNNIQPSINSIFKIRGENEIYLHETSLKANSKVDYAGRLTILYIYYQQTNGIDEVKRADVNNFLERTGLKNNGSYRGWITKNKSLYNINNGCYRLCRAGEERAKEYVLDVFSEDKNDGWKLGDSGKTSAKSNNANKKSQSNSSTYSIITSLNLSPSGKDSLKTFITKYNISSGMEYNTVFTYYLEKILNGEGLTPNHIYTCYKDIGIKFPSNLRQSLTDTKNRKGWIETANMNDLKLTTMGENAVEHDLKK